MNIHKEILKIIHSALLKESKVNIFLKILLSGNKFGEGVRDNDISRLWNHLD